MPNLSRGVDGGAQVAVVEIQLLQRPNGGVDAADGWRCAVAVRHSAAQLARGQAERAGKHDLLNRVKGDQVDAKHHAARGAGRRLDLHILEAAEAEDVRDRFAHGGGRERIAAPHFNQIENSGINGRLVLDQQLDVFDRSPDVLGGHRLRPTRAGAQDGDREQDESPCRSVMTTPHQNL